MPNNTPSVIPGVIQGALIGVGTVALGFLIEYFGSGSGASWEYAPVLVVLLMGVAKTIEVNALKKAQPESGVMSRSVSGSNERSAIRRILLG